MGVPLSKWVMIEEASDTAATRKLPYPVLDADNHLYETEEPFTNYLPKEYQGANKYVQVDNRRKIAIRGQISEFIPNPTFEVVARPGAMEEYFKHGNPEGKSRREIFGERTYEWIRL